MWVGTWSRECSPFWTGLVTAILTTNLLRWEVRTKERPRTQCTRLASVFITLDPQGGGDWEVKHGCSTRRRLYVRRRQTVRGFRLAYGA